MIGSLKLKVCGLTSADDAAAAARFGADALGFNFHGKSPRHLSLADYRSLAASLPAASRVAILVEPPLETLRETAAAGFDFFQVHFRHDTPLDRVRAWSAAAGPGALWLAPKLPPGSPFNPDWLPLADTFLIDTFSPDLFGGTGKTGDWEKFSRIQAEHPAKGWILSGGLNPENVAEAVRRSGARYVDVNSGVESSPGKKDPAKLRALAAALGGWAPFTRSPGGSRSPTRS
jgi:phosphoribosylanthranilate isomerase